MRMSLPAALRRSPKARMTLGAFAVKPGRYALARIGRILEFGGLSGATRVPALVGGRARMVGAEVVRGRGATPSPAGGFDADGAIVEIGVVEPHHDDVAERSLALSPN